MIPASRLPLHTIRARLILLCVCIPFLGAKVPVSDSDLVSRNITVSGKAVTISCLGDIPGKVKTQDGQLLFIPYQDLFRKFKKKYKASGNSKHRSKRRKNKKLWKTGTTACSGGDSDGGTGGPQDSYFDAFGNVTPLGLQVFEIPAGLEANAFTGEGVYTQYCTGCHEKRARPTFNMLRSTISQEPMYYTSDLLSDQLLAHLTAYLQIGRSPLRE